MKRGLKILALAIVMSALFVSCTKSGALTGSASSGTSGFTTVTGSVNGGLSPVNGATVSLFAAGTGTALAQATTNSTGSFTITFTNPGSGLLYLLATGGNAGGGVNSKNQLAAVLGLASNSPSSVIINELTTAAFADSFYNYGILQDSSGVVSFASQSQGAQNSSITQYNNFITNGSMNTTLSSTKQTALLALANALASCAEAPANCNALFGSAPSPNGGASISLLDTLVNAFQLPAANVAPVYNIGLTMNATTGYALPPQPSGLLFDTLPIVASSTITVGSAPTGIAFDSSGNIWVANRDSNNVTELSSTGSTLNTFATGGTTTRGIAIDTSGNLWVTSGGTNAVKELSSSGSVLGTFTVGSSPRNLAIDASGNVWVCNNGTTTVTKLSSSGTSLGTFSVGTNPEGIAVDSAGNVWTANTGSNTVTKLTSSGIPAGTFSVASGPEGLAIDAFGNVWVAINNSLVKLNAVGSTLGTFSSTGNIALAIDASGNIWDLSGSSNLITKVNSLGAVLGTYAVGNTPDGLVVDPSGNIWVTNQSGGNVTEEPGVTVGPQFFPYAGPMFPGGGNY